MKKSPGTLIQKRGENTMKINQVLKFALFVALVLFLVSCAPTADLAVKTEESSMPESGSEIDELFIDMMVPHHQGAVEMAKIALERSERPEIWELANAIISSQEAEITQLKTWKEQWYGSSETPSMQVMPAMGGGHAMDMQADVDTLKNASEPFDLAFIDAMIPHHQSAIDAAQIVINSAVHPEIKELALQIIEAQQKEIDQMTEWRQVWYPEASSSHMN
jgi:uncharacterized protein (DUF305 family)